ncbi:hypothetical protein [Streptomyces sp. TRM68367]|uniref:hypothetical protein n=1 Tax=Streptomyces sp. TRM68367 TaxID=2758415 RepID=UPI0021D292B8|nr:hypothetical protein [Streptomyces sp. TRM68367]
MSRPDRDGRRAGRATVRSRLGDHLPDHLLAEAVQERLSTVEEAERWWAGTFAAHQGDVGGEPLREAARFLTTAGCLRSTADDSRWETSPLGRLTSRFMVDATLADELATAVREALVPEDAFTAERLLAALLSTRLPALEQAPFTDRARAALRETYSICRHGSRTQAKGAHLPLRRRGSFWKLRRRLPRRPAGVAAWRVCRRVVAAASPRRRSPCVVPRRPCACPTG